MPYNTIQSIIKLFLLCITTLLLSCGDNKLPPDAVLNIQPLRANAPANITAQIQFNDKIPKNCTYDWNFGDGVKVSGLSSLTHTYNGASTYKITLKLNCENLSTTLSQNVEILPPADLHIQALEIRPLEITTGASAEIQFQLSNTQAPVLSPFNIDIYVSETNDLENFSPQINNRLAQLSYKDFPGENEKDNIQKILHTIPIPNTFRTASYYLIAVVDQENNVGETSKHNNIIATPNTFLIRNQKTDGAELQALRISISPLKTRILSSINASFDFINNGATAAIDFKYQIWISEKNNRDNKNNAKMIYESTINGAPSSQTVSIKEVLIPITPVIDSPGNYYFWLVLDSNNELLESNENNNEIVSLTPLTISDEPILDADIIIQNISFDPQTSYPKASIKIQLDLYNQGQQPTGSFICALYLTKNNHLQPDKDQLIASVNIPDLLPNTHSSYDTIAEISTDIKPDEYWVFSFCDASGVVHEANEDNNIQKAEKQLYIVATQKIDLTLNTIQKPITNPIKSGDALEFNYQICNEANVGAGPNILQPTLKNLCDYTTKDLPPIEIPPIEANKCINLTFKQKLNCDYWCNTYELKLTANATRTIEETNYNNNTKTLPEYININSPQCYCSADKLEPNNTQINPSPLSIQELHLSLCRNDEDFFTFDLNKNHSTIITLKSNTEHGRLKLTLWDNNNIIQETFADNYMQIPIYAQPENKTYIVQVSSYNNELNNYTIQRLLYTDPKKNDLAIKISKLNLNKNNINLTYKLYNLGNTTINTNAQLDFYLNTQNTISSALKLQNAPIPQIPPGSSVTQTIQLTLPNDLPSGLWRIIAVADKDNKLKDPLTINNVDYSTPWEILRDCWDTLEPNNTEDTPYIIKWIKNDNTLNFTAKKLCVSKTNHDYYQFEVPDGYKLNITATANSNSGDFDLTLFDIYLSELDKAKTAEPTEIITRDIIGKQTFILKVEQLNNQSNPESSTYDLVLQATPIPQNLQCNNVYEPNNHALQPFPLLQALSEAKTAAICPSTDQDFYEFLLHAGQNFKLAFNTTEANLRAVLYAPGQSFAAILTDLRKQKINYYAPTTGQYLLKIYTNTSQIKNQNYKLISELPTGLDIAVFDLKITPPNPAPLSTIQLSFNIRNLSATPVNQYKIKITISENNNTITLLDKQQTTPLNPTETINFSQKFDLPAAISKPTLTVEIIPPDTQPDIFLPNNTITTPINLTKQCTNDTYEPNDDLSIAKPLSTNNANLCSYDLDWYIINVNDNQNLNCTISFNHAEADLDLYLYNKDKTLLLSSRTTTNTEKIDYTSTEQQDLYLLVKALDPNTFTNYQISCQ